MKLQTSQIDLDSLKVDKTKIDFSLEDNQQEIEYLARTIVELEGWSVRIPVVQEVGIEDYELVSGYFDYYALLKAREIEPNLPDRIRVFILNKKNYDSVIKQLEAIDKLEKITRQSHSDRTTSEKQDLKDIQITNLSAKLEDSQQAIIERIDALKTTIIDSIDSKMPKPLPLLDALNQILDDRVADSVIEKMSLLLNKKKAKKIVNKLREHKKKYKTKFKTFYDVLENGLGKGYISKEKLLEVIDHWN